MCCECTHEVEQGEFHNAIWMIASGSDECASQLTYAIEKRLHETTMPVRHLACVGFPSGRLLWGCWCCASSGLWSRAGIQVDKRFLLLEKFEKVACVDPPEELRNVFVQALVPGAFRLRASSLTPPPRAGVFRASAAQAPGPEPRHAGEQCCGSSCQHRQDRHLRSSFGGGEWPLWSGAPSRQTS